jgi:hypothetical protein
VNSFRTTVVFGLAATVAVLEFAPSAEAIDRPVVVNGSSLSDPIGVGFGHWEGAEPLKIILSADPCEIATAEMFAAEAVIWTATDSSKPDPWVFETAAILPDEAFAVQFAGALDCGGRGGGKPTPPPEWAVAVSDIDLDCDSDNDGVRPGRAPSASDFEDSVELPLGNSGSTAQGMLMEIGEEWAVLRINAHVKKASEFTLALQGPAADSFILADANLQVVDHRVHVENVPPGELTRSFYVKPSSTATDQDTAIVAAMLVANQGSGSASGVAEDKSAITATKSVWKCEAPDGQVVVLNADGVYDDARNPAKSKRLVITSPAVLPENTKFRLRRSKKLALFLDEPGTQPIPTNAEGLTDPIAAPGAGKSKTYYVRGAASNDLSGQNASATLNDQSVAILVGDAATPECEKSWTVLWVDLSVRGTQADAVSPDNSGIFGWVDVFRGEVEPDETAGPKALGARGNGVNDGGEVFLLSDGLFNGVEVRGGVHPGDFERHLAWRRDIMGFRVYSSKDGVIKTILGGSQSEDGVDGILGDIDPQSGGSNGVIYDLDGPGVKSELALDDDALPVGAVLKHRANFQQWAMLGSERCSERMPWYVRIARRRIAVGDLTPYESIGGAEENHGKRGVTGLGYDPGADPAMMLTVTAQPTYNYARLATTATASVAGQYTQGVTFNWTFDAEGRPPVLVQGDTNAQEYEFRGNIDNHGKHIIAVEATDSSAPALSDAASVRVFSNHEPTAVIEYARLSPDRSLILVKGRAEDPEGKLFSPENLNNEWLIQYFNQDGNELETDAVAFGLGVEGARPLPDETARIVVILTVIDEAAAEGHAISIVDVTE